MSAYAYLCLDIDHNWESQASVHKVWTLEINRFEIPQIIDVIAASSAMPPFLSPPDKWLPIFVKQNECLSGTLKSGQRHLPQDESEPWEWIVDCLLSQIYSGGFLPTASPV